MHARTKPNDNVRQKRERERLMHIDGDRKRERKRKMHEDRKKSFVSRPRSPIVPCAHRGEIKAQQHRTNSDWKHTFTHESREEKKIDIENETSIWLRSISLRPKMKKKMKKENNARDSSTVLLYNADVYQASVYRISHSCRAGSFSYERERSEPLSIGRVLTFKASKVNGDKCVELRLSFLNIFIPRHVEDRSSIEGDQRYSQARCVRPLSVTGVSHKLSTCRRVKCSEINSKPASPNYKTAKRQCLLSCARGWLLTCVDQRLRYLKAGSLIKCSAQALVTLVKAKLRHSRLPNDPLESNFARSLSVEREGKVSFLGPPFCCSSRKAICRSHTLAYIFNPVAVDWRVEINCNLLSRFSTASRSNMAQRVYKRREDNAVVVRQTTPLGIILLLMNFDFHAGRGASAPVIIY